MICVLRMFDVLARGVILWNGSSADHRGAACRCRERLLLLTFPLVLFQKDCNREQELFRSVVIVRKRIAVSTDTFSKTLFLGIGHNRVTQHGKRPELSPQEQSSL